jgi:hypothetical protein
MVIPFSEIGVALIDVADCQECIGERKGSVVLKVARISLFAAIS